MSAHMHVILARDVINLGKVGEVVRVRPGYARNFLLPRQFALPVSPSRVAHFEHQKKLVEHQRIKLRAQSENLKKELAAIQVTVSAKAGEHGKLFGSIGTRDIAHALAAQGYKVDHRDVKLEHPLKTIGMHPVELRLEADVKAQVNVVVVPEVVEEVAPVAVQEAAATEAVEEISA